MFLKRITVAGFKSFGDKVDFEFGPGVTCIVGPNGCGKSNVVDAFRWVLGEQSARSLRGHQMSDMIFNGSSTRRSTSVAQVDLVFDNADRALTYDHEEVTVTRKLYRSGESEYLLNRETVRRKDIKELLMDTGVGVDAYSVIEQGRVDSLLQSNPADRRLIFEEAAGISKYKARRREAERKLDRTQQNLLRVDDIVAELEKQLRSVKLQAGKARNYREYEARLNELRSGFAMAEYHRFSNEIRALTEQVRESSDQAKSIRTEIGGHEESEVELGARLDCLGEEVNGADSAFLQSKSELMAQEERIESAKERALEQRGLLDRLRQRHKSDTDRLGESKAAQVDAQETAVALDEEMRILQERSATLEEQDRALSREYAQAHAVLEDEKAGIIELLRKSAQLHNEIVRLNTHRESLVGQKGRLSERDSKLTVELESKLENKARLERRVRELDEVIEAETNRLEEKKGEATRARELCKQLSVRLSEAKERRSALDSRRDVLEDLERRMEGVGTGARRLLDRKQLPDAPAALDHLVGLVGVALDADVEHARVVEAALGESTQYLMLRERRALIDHPEIFGALGGRLTTICLDRIGPLVNVRDFSDQPGYVARAIEFVRFSEDIEPLARLLLGKTIVVDSLATAVSMSADDVSGHRFVTLEGEVVEADGRVTLGPASASAGLITRRSKLREIEGQTVELADEIRAIDDRLNEAQVEAEHLDGVLQELRTAIYECNTAKVEARTALENIIETVTRLTHEQPLIAQEVAMLEHQINEVLERSEEGGRSLGEVEEENMRREAGIASHKARMDEAAAKRQSVRESFTEKRILIGQLSEKRSAVDDRLRALQRNIQELEESLSGAMQDLESCEERIASADLAVVTGRERLSGLTSEVHELEARCAELRRQRESLRRDAEHRLQSVKTLRSKLEEVEAGGHQHQVSLTEITVRRDDLVARVAEEMNIDLAQRYEQYEEQESDWEQVESEIAELRGKMERLGNVNLDAISELEELEQRHAFLVGQRDDLAQSRRQLEQLIDKLNRESRDRFRSAFDQIRENFKALFRKLFGGGRADVILQDPDDILECGIEILAQPPGKELQSISLMSGGEKSLTAIALLMSIFKSRPAPCAFMDEVDAALDEANNERFNRIILEFVKDTQFIIITHSKWTMNIAEHLYGITMQEPGVSTRVSVELTGANVA
jgi:chromosome segregation protein